MAGEKCINCDMLFDKELIANIAADEFHDV